MEKQAKKFKRYDQGEFWRNPSNNVLEKNEIQGTDCQARNYMGLNQISRSRNGRNRKNMQMGLQQTLLINWIRTSRPNDASNWTSEFLAWSPGWTVIIQLRRQAIQEENIQIVQFEVPLQDPGEKNKAGDEIINLVWRYTGGNHLDITEIKRHKQGYQEEYQMT